MPTYGCEPPAAPRPYGIADDDNLFEACRKVRDECGMDLSDYEVLRLVYIALTDYRSATP
jgi:hypothetical protein